MPVPESELEEVAEDEVAAVVSATEATVAVDDLGLQPHAAFVWPMAKAASARMNVWFRLVSVLACVKRTVLHWYTCSCIFRKKFWEIYWAYYPVLWR